MKDKHLLFGTQATPERLQKRERLKKIMRPISTVLFIAALAGIIYLLYPILKGFGQEGWIDSVGERIQSYSSIEGIVIFFLIQALQVVVAVIPAIQIVGGVLYGWFWGTVLSFLGILFGTLVVWAIVKRVGAPLVETMINEKQLKRFSFLENEHKLILLLMVLYFIPAIPKDVITYLVPLTKIRLRDFVLYVLPCRIPAILLSAVFGNNVTHGNYTTAIILVCIIAAVSAAGVVCRKKILEQKSKEGNTAKQKHS